MNSSSSAFSLCSSSGRNNKQQRLRQNTAQTGEIENSGNIFTVFKFIKTDLNRSVQYDLLDMSTIVRLDEDAKHALAYQKVIERIVIEKIARKRSAWSIDMTPPRYWHTKIIHELNQKKVKMDVEFQQDVGS